VDLTTQGKRQKEENGYSIHPLKPANPGAATTAAQQ